MENNRKMSTGLSLFGFILGLVFNRFYLAMPSGTTLEIILIVVSIIWNIFGIWYCFAKFPSLINNYLVENTSSKLNLSTIEGTKLVSFCNGFVGIIFGFLWNYNLNRSKTGISCYIVGGLLILNLVSSVVSLFV